jgi:hypothetical protein
MAWIEKDKPTPFDAQPIRGLHFLDGDIVARHIGRDWTAGQKCPLVAFPSGHTCELWEASAPEHGGIAHVFGELDLPLKDTRDAAFARASAIAEQCGYRARRVGETGLEVWGHDTDEHFLISYDADLGEMADIQPVKDERPEPYRPPLLPDAIRQRLPALYATEDLGLEALAQVKFFTPDAAWSWFASEFDGDDMMFGLVIGHEIELGYFRLSELEEARGPLGLRIERDLHYAPTSLRELRDQHHRGRGD